MIPYRRSSWKWQAAKTRWKVVDLLEEADKGWLLEKLLKRERWHFPTRTWPWILPSVCSASPFWCFAAAPFKMANGKVFSAKMMATSLSLLGRISFLATRESLNVKSTQGLFWTKPDQRHTPLGNFVGKFGQAIRINLLIMVTWIFSFFG